MRVVICKAMAAVAVLTLFAPAVHGANSSRLIDVPAAIETWKAKPRKGETTATMEKRVRVDLQKMMQNADKLDYDVGHWKFLDYLRERPWNTLPERWKKWYLVNQPNPRLTDEQRTALIDSIKDVPIYQLTPKQVDALLGWAQKEYPDLRQRIMFFARKNINQPYKIYLLGEFPYEVYDPDPLFSLTNSDCVVFSEHTYAMALSKDWAEFFRTLQKIRYKNGEVGMTTRNHYTEADWDKNNDWLVHDVTDDLGATTISKYTEKIDRAQFFRHFGIGQGIQPETLHDTYIPADAVASVLDKLKDGDFVNVVRGIGDGVWVGHVGLVGHGKDGAVDFINSTEPKVKEVSMLEYVNDNVKKNVERAKKNKAQFLGLKFLRLRDNPEVPK